MGSTFFGVKRERNGLVRTGVIHHAPGPLYKALQGVMNHARTDGLPPERTEALANLVPYNGSINRFVELMQGMDTE